MCEHGGKSTIARTAMEVEFAHTTSDGMNVFSAMEQACVYMDG